MSLGFLCATDKYLSNSDKVIRTGEISIQPQCMLAFGDAAQHAWATFLQVPGTYVRAHGLGPMTGLWTTSLRLLRRSRQDQVQIQARLQSMLASSVRPSRRPDSKSPWRKISVAGHVPCRRSNERIDVVGVGDERAIKKAARFRHSGPLPQKEIRFKL
jgi:hypothetical protein